MGGGPTRHPVSQLQRLVLLRAQPLLPVFQPAISARPLVDVREEGDVAADVGKLRLRGHIGVCLHHRADVVDRDPRAGQIPLPLVRVPPLVDISPGLHVRDDGGVEMHLPRTSRTRRDPGSLILERLPGNRGRDCPSVYPPLRLLAQDLRLVLLQPGHDLPLSVGQARRRTAGRRVVPRIDQLPGDAARWEPEGQGWLAAGMPPAARQHVDVPPGRRDTRTPGPIDVDGAHHMAACRRHVVPGEGPRFAARHGERPVIAIEAALLVAVGKASLDRRVSRVGVLDVHACLPGDEADADIARRAAGAAPRPVLRPRGGSRHRQHREGGHQSGRQERSAHGGAWCPPRVLVGHGKSITPRGSVHIGRGSGLGLRLQTEPGTSASCAVMTSPPIMVGRGSSGWPTW